MRMVLSYIEGFNEQMKTRHRSRFFCCYGATSASALTDVKKLFAAFNNSVLHPAAAALTVCQCYAAVRQQERSTANCRNAPKKCAHPLPSSTGDLRSKRICPAL
jgi:hypothetical protein